MSKVLYLGQRGPVQVSLVFNPKPGVDGIEPWSVSVCEATGVGEVQLIVEQDPLVLMCTRFPMRDLEKTGSTFDLRKHWLHTSKEIIGGQLDEWWKQHREYLLRFHRGYIRYRDKWTDSPAAGQHDGRVVCQIVRGTLLSSEVHVCAEDLGINKLVSLDRATREEHIPNLLAQALQ